MKKIFFFHIAKTAGSSFNQFLANYCAGEEHCERYLTEGELSVNLDHLAQLDYVSGHIRFPSFLKAGFAREDYFLMTFIREPLAQLLSHLNWVMYLYEISPSFFNSHPQVVQAMSLELRSLDLYNTNSFIAALQKFSGWFQNNQSRYFADSHPTLCKDEAIENLSQLDMIGLTEHYEQSLRHFVKLRQLEITNRPFAVVNKNPGYRVRRDILENPAIYEFLLDYNKVDIEVYNYFYPRIVSELPQRSVA